MTRYDNWKLTSPYRDCEPDPNCEMCDGTGYITEGNDPDNERECTCMSEEANRRRAAEEAADRAEDRWYGGMR